MRSWVSTVCRLLVGMVLSLVLLGCRPADPITVGFSAELTGRVSGLGVSARNAVSLAFEEKNAAGGIDGRELRLIARDDRQDPEVARSNDQALIDEGVVAIIGHMTTAMTTAALPVVNRAEVLMISPTTSSNDLTGIDDYLVRVIPEQRRLNVKHAEYARNAMGLQTLAIVYDTSNRDFSESVRDVFSTRFEALGGRTVVTVPFDPADQAGFDVIADQILAHSPDGVLIVAGAVDAALACQRVRQRDREVALLSVGWALTQEFVQLGGAAVEGVVFSTWYHGADTSPAYVQFAARFAERFGYAPDIAATYGYEVAQILIFGLEHSPSADRLKQTIVSQAVFDGLQGRIVLDEYGDADREPVMLVVQDSRFVRVP